MLLTLGISHQNFGQGTHPSNTFFGTNTGSTHTNSTPVYTFNSAFGNEALITVNTTAPMKFNSAFGYRSLKFNIGSGNSAFGYDAMRDNSTGSHNVAIGNSAMMESTGGLQNIAIGYKAMNFNDSGSYNIGIGYEALQGQVTGEYNIAIGRGAMSQLTSGSWNLVMGQSTGVNLTTGTRNTIIGTNSGAGLTTGSYNTFIGRINNIGAATNNTVILADGNGGQKLYIHSNGYAGIGLGDNIIPQNRLEIASGVSGTAGLRFRGINSSSPTAGNYNGKFLTVNSNGDVVLAADGGSNGSYENIYTHNGTITTTTGLRTVTMGNNNLFFNTNGSNFADGTQGSGRIYIGNTLDLPPLDSTGATTGSISQYRLLVEGGILTEKVKVAVAHSVNWADYIFEDNYKLTPLNEVETFIKENKHLSGIESAENLVKNGLDLGDMQAKQLAKIEELTLYLIEQNKTLEKQTKEIEELKVQVKALLSKSN